MPTPQEFKLLKVIQKIELFSHLTTEAGQIVISLGKRKTHKSGSSVFRKGELRHFFTVVLSRQLLLHETTHTTDPGQSNGAINALTHRPHWFTVKAQLESTILSSDILNLRTLILSNPASCSKILGRTSGITGNLLDIQWQFYRGRALLKHNTSRPKSTSWRGDCIGKSVP